MAKGHKHIAALDIGTTEIRMVVGEVAENEKLEVVGISRAPSHGVRRGVVVNIEAAGEAIKTAANEAEAMSGLPVDTVYVGLGGANLRGMNSRGVVAVRHNRIISEEDISRVIEQARAISVPTDREIIEVLPQEFIVDGQDGIVNPIEFLGMRLEAAVHVVTSPLSARQNVVKAVNYARMEVADTVVNHLAGVEATLTSEEREYGAAIIDIGADITNLTIMHRDAVRHTAVFPVGGSHLTNDIAVGLRTPVPEAERIKRNEGCALAPLMDEKERSRAIEIPTVGGRQPRIISRQILCEILQPRAEDIFGYVFDEIQRAGYEKQMLSSVVLVGGGSLLEGMVEMAEQVLDLPARHGMPSYVGGLSGEVNSPAFATVVGIMLYGAQRIKSLRRMHSVRDASSGRESFIEKIGRWYKDRKGKN